jgi:hypothetical protein
MTLTLVNKSAKFKLKRKETIYIFWCAGYSLVTSKLVTRASLLHNQVNYNSQLL